MKERIITTTKDTGASVDVGQGIITTEVFGIEQQYMAGSYLPPSRERQYKGNCVVGGRLPCVTAGRLKSSTTSRQLIRPGSNIALRMAFTRKPSVGSKGSFFLL